MSGDSAIVLVSGGLDSATLLAMARQENRRVHAVSFAYGQRSLSELDAAQRVVGQIGADSHKIIPIGLGDIGGSALTDEALAVPEGGTAEGIPVTYVPARNTVFLALALGWAEIVRAGSIYIGVNAVDYSGYPDCRPAFIDAFQRLARVATKQGVEGHPVMIRAPLIDLSKAQIIRQGMQLRVDYALTVSCYNADPLGRACGRCDSCRLRSDGFFQAGVPDPTRYQQHQ